MKKVIFFLLIYLIANSQIENPFEQLQGELPTPNEIRTASGAPGPKYWQQKVDYKIQVKLIEEGTPKIEGKVKIIYHNNSPHTLEYLWVQLDQNKYKEHSLYRETAKYGEYSKLRERERKRLLNPFVGGYNLHYVRDEKGKELRKYIYDTNMRIDLDKPLKPGETFVFEIKYDYLISNAEIEGRSGYKYFPEDGNYIFTIAQFFPRMCAYTDTRGWQNNPFIGTGEFALEFGDYYVEISVPADHIVAATGELQNPKDVLTPEQIKRLEQAKKTDKPVFIVTKEEALENLKEKDKNYKTWKFKAENVRDFAFASSRRFVWDAASIVIEGKRIMTHALYSPEMFNLWSKYANYAVQHALKVYSKYSVAYPYPHATTVYGAVWGMEYPMMAFCGSIYEDAEDYSIMNKYSTISVIIHEVGHNFFPMIINNDERQWGWLDEGLNSFIEYLAEKEWEPDYPSRRGQPFVGTKYVKKTTDQPIMTRPEEIRELGNNAYTKVAMALTILRETILGREAFDKAFKTYCERWKFKRPEPADFFRTIEDVSGKDLDWFWRQWFFGTDYVDIIITSVKGFPVNSEEYPYKFDYEITEYLNAKEGKKYFTDIKPELIDDYTTTKKPEINDDLKAAKDNAYIYQITFKNIGGIVSPVILRLYYEDNSSEIIRFPVEIWLKNPEITTVSFKTSKRIIGIHIDPYRQTGDADESNNWWGIIAND